ncbi:Alcohol dehydrogenase zinc-binding domain protein [Streptomyces bingchenggensis BCW-1]|uniref:Alcohol dehydrogenase zinc-binding domain protein n=1 Tax=Streptomyces bingchenggensis (strain BCW-1) TaxID=749414 RepID=D7C0R1_STRBB|nr:MULTISPECIES: zinc-binding dehydrogenase [Streptomyces]ADI05783.1 Alcohol dehydrogenase zinc-binding domain protein [Streptomyces bingchenggensis BCW-1]
MPALNMRTYTVTRELTAHPEQLRRAEACVSSGLRNGAFQPVVDRPFTLDAIVEAHRYMEAGAQVGKIVVTVDH